MPDLVAAVSAAMIGSGFPAIGEGFFYNPMPQFALVTTFPRTRFQSDPSGVFLTPRKELVLTAAETRMQFRPIWAGEDLDVLPAEKALSYETAVAIGRQASSLVGDDSPDVDLGSAL